MSLLSLLQDWLPIYLAVGLLWAIAMTVTKVIEHRRCFTRSEALHDKFPSGRHGPSREALFSTLAEFLLITIVWLPLVVSVVFQTIRDGQVEKRRKAWETSPEGKAHEERAYREMVEKEVAPWIPLAWLTERNIPWEQFAADYRESEAWAPLARDAFQLLWSQVAEADEVGYFSTPPETWQKNFGRAGWVVLRDGKVVGQLVTVMN